MTRLVTVFSGFEAKVIAARLGSEGIVSQLRGGVDGPYPIGPVHVFVAERDLPLARELLLEAEVEGTFLAAERRAAHGTSAGRAPASLWIVVLALSVVALALLGHLLTYR